MARRDSRRLGVWLDGRRVAELDQPKFPRIRLRYTEEALEAWPRNSPVVSCSLPLTDRPQDALVFCKGLLPEGQALQALAARARVSTFDTFALLARYGRDVAGALVIAEEPPDAAREGVEPYTDASLREAVEELDEFPLGAHDDSELSLAGLQDKLLLVDLGDGRWGRPVHGRPSTHILKRDDLRHPGLVEAEGRCLALARAVGLTTIDHRVERLGDTPCLIVSRFDRAPADDGRGVRRIHQEDVCQATGVDPDGAGGRGKYERAGGPGFRDVARLLDEHAADPQDELDRLVAAATFTVVIGNADAHGKNVALLHPSPGTVTLAPLYDTVPTALWPKLRAEAAMTVDRVAKLADVTLDDLAAEAAAWPHARRRAREVAARTAQQLADAATDGTIPADTDVARFVRDRAARLLATA